MASILMPLLLPVDSLILRNWFVLCVMLGFHTLNNIPRAHDFLFSCSFGAEPGTQGFTHAEDMRRHHAAAAPLASLSDFRSSEL